MVIQMQIENVETECFFKIKSAVEINLDKYLERDDYWLGDFLQELGFELREGTTVGDPVLELDGTSVSESDQNNAIRLHKALDLSPELAGNGLFWTILSHHYAAYIRKRLRLNAKTSNLVKKVSENFVFEETMSKRERREGILPRLWSIADLTFVEGASDPYHLTRVALSDLDLANQILDRIVFMDRRLVRVFLERYDARSKEGNPMSRVECRAIFKNLNALSQTIVLGSLSNAELREQILWFEEWYSRNHEKQPVD